MRLAAHRNRYRAFHAALTDLYAEAPSAQSATLGGYFSVRSGFAAASGPSDTPDFSDATFSDAASIVRRAGQFTPEMMRRPEVRRLVSETAGIFREAIDAHIPTEVSPEVTFALQNNAFIFSGFKVYHSLQEVGLSLLDDKGNIKPLADFQRDVQQINDKYNHNYLRAEYQHAVGSTLMAARWQQIEADGDRYDLQYRTAQDDRVREDHRLLDGTTLPPSDPFWSKYYPPNGWGCRCTAVQVRRGKFPHTDPKLAMQRGDNCTENAKQQMFRFNPGKELKIFPPKHPYYKAPQQAKPIVEQVSVEEMQRQRLEDMIKEMPDNLTDEQKKAIAKNNLEIEEKLKIHKGKPMTVNEADEQSANPNYTPKFLPDPNGTYYDKAGNRFSLNPQYKVKYHKNCATCAPAYALRLRGFNVTAKPKKRGSLNEKASESPFEMWKNADGSPAQPVTMLGWAQKKGYSAMTEQRYREYFEDVCKEPGVYELTIAWRDGGAHATILQKEADGKIFRIEPQVFNGNARRTLDDLCHKGKSRIYPDVGIMRVDDKVFDIDWLDLFDH